MTRHRPFHNGCPPNASCQVDRRALLLWPGLDRHALARCHHDARRIALLVARRTSLSQDAIAALLTAPVLTSVEQTTYFG